MHPAVRLQLIAYGLLLVAIGYRSLQGDSLLYVFDFLPLLLVVPAMIAFQALDKSVWLNRLFTMALTGSLVGLAVVLFQYFILGDGRPAGIENSPIHYSILALTIGFVAMGGFFVRPDLRGAPFLLGPVLGITTALMTGTRASLPSLLMLSIAAVLLFVVFGRVKLRQLAIGIFAVSIVGGVAIAITLGLETDATRAVAGLDRAFRAVMGDTQADTSMAYRLEQYRAFLPAFLDAPVFGQGWHNQLTAAYPFLSPFGQAGYDREGWGYIHNEALSMTLGMGILGLCAYIMIYAAPILGLWHMKTAPQFAARAYGVTIILVGIFAGGLTDVLFMVELPKTFLIFMTIAFLAVGSEQANAREAR